MPNLRINVEGVWKPLRAGDRVDVVAPARQGKTGELELIKTFLKSWELEAHIPDQLIAEDLLCANTDAQRLKFLVDALNDSEASAIWCLRGGYGCTRLMPELIKLKNVPALKWFIGFSDITILHSWLNESWQWPTLHGPSLRQLATNEIDELTQQTLKALLFGYTNELVYSNLEPMNTEQQDLTEAIITGGNLCLVENSIGTPWQLKTANKIILLEETHEAAYRIDRSLNHLLHAKILQETAAVILGDFDHIDPQEEQRINQVLQLFADQCPCPVYRLPGIGHGTRNLPIPLGITAKIA